MHSQKSPSFPDWIGPEVPQPGPGWPTAPLAGCWSLPLQEKGEVRPGHLLSRRLEIPALHPIFSPQLAGLAPSHSLSSRRLVSSWRLWSVLPGVTGHNNPRIAIRNCFAGRNIRQNLIHKLFLAGLWPCDFYVTLFTPLGLNFLICESGG